jgi:hypothetical protein
MGSVGLDGLSLRCPTKEEGSGGYVLELKGLLAAKWGCRVTIIPRLTINGAPINLPSFETQPSGGERQTIPINFVRRSKLKIGQEIIVTFSYYFIGKVATLPAKPMDKDRIIQLWRCRSGADSKRFDFAFSQKLRASKCACCALFHEKLESPTTCNPATLDPLEYSRECPEGSRTCLTCPCGTCEDYGRLSSCPQGKILDKKIKVPCPEEPGKFLDCVTCKDPPGSSGGGGGWD